WNPLSASGQPFAANPEHGATRFRLRETALGAARPVSNAGARSDLGGTMLRSRKLVELDLKQAQDVAALRALARSADAIFICSISLVIFNPRLSRE
ncbi:MAG: hypothetical protein AAB133_03125, partial [Pseudomonadota bacterium]